MQHLKRLVALILCLVIVSLSLFACKKHKNDSDTATTTEITLDTEGYKSIECYIPDGYEKKYFSFSGSDYVIDLMFPRGWSFSKNEDGSATISRNNKVVGSLIKGGASEDSWQTIKKDSYTSDTGLTTKLYLEGNASEENKYRFRYEYTYNEDSKKRTLTLLCDYAEISEFSQTKMLCSSTLTTVSSDIGLGALSDVSNAKTIAIFGNSFVGSSAIGPILQEMLDNNGKKVSVISRSIGYATVETYASNPAVLEVINDGFYDVIFICGFYSGDEVEHLGTLKRACDKSNTKLVIFPAHNEQTGVVRSACSTYKNLTCINWKAEIDMLIDGGIDMWKFCINDGHKHSTDLAGYVGAHMIYRALYGKVPQKGMTLSMRQSEIDKILGDYAKTGGAVSMDKSEITYIGSK